MSVSIYCTCVVCKYFRFCFSVQFCFPRHLLSVLMPSVSHQLHDFGISAHSACAGENGHLRRSTALSPRRDVPETWRYVLGKDSSIENDLVLQVPCSLVTS